MAAAESGYWTQVLIASVKDGGRSESEPFPDDPGTRDQALRGMIRVLFPEGRISKTAFDLCVAAAKRLGVPSKELRALVFSEIVSGEASQAASSASTSSPRPGAVSGGPPKAPSRALAAPGSGAMAMLPNKPLAVKAAGAVLGLWVVWGLFLGEYLAFRRASQPGAAQAREGYLSRYKSGGHRDRILRMKDDDGYAAAQAAASVGAYEDYAARFPGGAHLAEARRSAADQRYSGLARTGDVKGYEDFLGLYQDDPRAKDVRAKLEAACYSKASRTNDLAAAERYLALFPKGPRASDIALLRESLIFEAAMKVRSIGEMEAFMKKFPGGAFAAKAGEQIEYLEYRKLFDGRKLPEAEAFLSAHPKSRYRSSVERLRAEIIQDAEDEEFRSIVSSKDPQRISGFLALHPRTIHRRELQKLRAALFDEAIRAYARFAREHSSNAQAVQFFTSMLNFLKTSGGSDLHVGFKRQIELKDWEDFPAELRALADRNIEANNKENAEKPAIGEKEPRYPSMSQNPPPSVRTAFTRQWARSLEGDVAKAVQSSLVQMFGRDLFHVRIHEDEPPSDNGVSLTVRYTIRNQYGRRTGVPLTVERTRKRPGGAEAEYVGRVLGIELFWDVRMSIAGTGRTYRIQDRSLPQVSRTLSASEAESLSLLYNEMTKEAFSSFTSKLIENFGMAPAEGGSQ